MAITIVLEVGASIASANSWIAATTASNYIERHGLDSAGAWASASSEEQKAALIAAGQYLNYVPDWKGYRYDEPSDQSMAWPRFGVIDNDGFTIATEIPQVVKDAQAELALKFITDGDLYPDLGIQADAVKSKQVGPIKLEYFKGGGSHKTYSKVNMLLSGLVNTSARISRA